MREAATHVRGERQRPFTGRTQQQMLAQVRASLLRSSEAVSAEIASVQREAHTDSYRGLVSFMEKMEGRRLPIESSQSVDQVLRARRTEMSASVRSIVARNTRESLARIHEQLRELRSRGATNAEALAHLSDAMESESYRLTRIVRTETSHAYNAAQYDGIASMRRFHPDIMSRWVEHVSDASWEPLDKKVAADSIALHGQVTPPGNLFTMPNDPSVSDALWGKTWEFPPNRPNDRAIIMPWRKAWGVPGWRFSGDRRRWIVSRAA